MSLASAEESVPSLPPASWSVRDLADLPAAPRPWRSKLLLVRHQIAAGIGTAADFGAMIAFVQLAHLSPPVATLFSAAIGGVVNFFVSRKWAFKETHSGSVGSQAWRYAVASAGGALLNALVLALFLAVVTIPYPFARALVSVLVSLLYTYPVHTRLVFRVKPATSWNESAHI